MRSYKDAFAIAVLNFDTLVSELNAYFISYGGVSEVAATFRSFKHAQFRD